jgi:glutamate--cysteine ligase catalytic subunit
MGLLSSGTPLGWEAAKYLTDKIREDGVEQLIGLISKLKDRKSDCLRWGDEVEYVMIKYNEEKRQCHVTVRAEEVLEALKAEMRDKFEFMGDSCPTEPKAHEFTATWHPEFGRYMLEGTPAKPYRDDVKDLLCVERDMNLRRKQAEILFKQDESLLSIGNFPRLGCPDSFADPLVKNHFTNEASKSLFFPDEFINSHPRFKFSIAFN